MSKHLFENPAIVYVGLAFIEVILLIVWRRRRTKQAARWLIAPPAAAVLVGLLAFLVVTDREYIINACGEMAGDLSAGQTDAIETYLDDTVHVDLGAFGGHDLSKLRAVEAAEGYIRRGSFRRVTVMGLTIEVKQRTAKVGVTTLIYAADAESGLQQGLLLYWPTDWVERDDGWRVTEVEAPQQKTFP
ncbi:MAG: hypothetical protein ACYS8X_11455 [Planctomycetota bacterium]|jgi:hypothetical protein